MFFFFFFFILRSVNVRHQDQQLGAANVSKQGMTRTFSKSRITRWAKGVQETKSSNSPVDFSFSLITSASSDPAPAAFGFSFSVETFLVTLVDLDATTAIAGASLTDATVSGATVVSREKQFSKVAL